MQQENAESNHSNLLQLNSQELKDLIYLQSQGSEERQAAAS